jgi:thioredoxin-like negative regulator of GroEL
VRRRRPGYGHDPRALELSQLADVTAAELDDLLRREDRLVLVDFWTPGCEPCRELRAQLEDLAEESGELCTIVAVDVGRDPDAAARHQVGQAPTLVFFKHGRELHRLRGGALPASTRALIARS